MRKIIILSTAAFLMSCCARKNVSPMDAQQDPSLLKSELYCNNCDSVLAFLKAVIVNNNSDKNLKAGHFRIPHIISTFENAKSLFHEKCFLGMPENDLIEILGEWDYSGTSANHPSWYILQNINHQLAIEVWIRDGLVEKFKVEPSTNEPTNR